MTIDIIETAREAGFVLEGDLSGAGRLPMLLERFAALVRAKVLEEAAQVCEQWGAWNNVAQQCAGAIRGMADSGHSAAAGGCASTAPLPDGYYLASFKRRSLDGCVTWWGPDSAGYTTDLATAGLYTADECNAICQRGTERYTVPVPVAFVSTLRIRRTVDPGDTLNRPFWSAQDLRAALDATHRRSLSGDQKPNEQDKSASPSVLLIRGEK